MKKLLITILFLFALFSNQIHAQKAEAKATYTYNFPKEMGEGVKKQYIPLFDRGNVLYQINCAKCHNIKVNGVEQMPQFTKEHLAQYELRVQNAKHEEELTEMRVNAEELQQIMIFLTYYKKVEQNAKTKK